MAEYVSSYVWPNPAFPFRIYLEHDNLRLFIIENIHHNWAWMKEWSEKFQERDYFFVYCGWFHGETFVNEDLRLFQALRLDMKRFFFLFNSVEEEEIYRRAGFRGAVINHNAWLDEDGVMFPEPGVIKKYDAIYVARHSPFKRHELSNKVNNLALIIGNAHGNVSSRQLPFHVYKNDAPLPPDEVRGKINESYVGLILSDTEGACFASSEYLLCGVPVVSTHSHGGRSEWYTSYNSILCDPDPVAVAEAVKHFVQCPPDPSKIRGRHLALGKIYRDRFVNHLSELLYRHGVDLDPVEYFNSNYMHKLRRSYKPDFSSIWG